MAAVWFFLGFFFTAAQVQSGVVTPHVGLLTLFCLTGESITTYHGTGVPVPPEHLPILAVPTTAGTGSEVTCVSVLTNHAEGKKCPINSNSFYPAIAIIDPELTVSMPPKVTASTGIDVLCHALEGFWSMLRGRIYLLLLDGYAAEYDYRGRKQVILCASAKFYNDSKCPLRKFRRGRFMRLPVPACAN